MRGFPSKGVLPAGILLASLLLTVLIGTISGCGTTQKATSSSELRPTDERQGGTLATSISHACRVLANGTAECWGNNSQGGLGDGTTESKDFPVPVTGKGSYRQIATGDLHTCALTEAGAIHCWGGNQSGQIGTETGSLDGLPMEGTAEPVEVTSGDFVDLVSGSDHTCVLSQMGEVSCWGSNRNGQLGNGSRRSEESPTPVTGLPPMSDLAAGTSHTCGVTEDGIAYCWGWNSAGQIGAGSEKPRHLEPAQVATEERFVRISAGVVTTCGLTEDGRAYCWGRNDFGQVGDETTTDRSKPTSVVGDYTFARIDVGLGHTCALTPEGSAYCWGSNRSGQLGDGTSTDRPAPVKVSGDHRFHEISAGNSETCARSTQGTTLCWGNRHSPGTPNVPEPLDSGETD